MRPPQIVSHFEDHSTWYVFVEGEPKSGTGLSQDSPFNLSVRSLFSLERWFLCLAFLARTQRFSRSSDTQSNRTHCTRVRPCDQTHGGPRSAHRWSDQRPRRLPTTNCGRQARNNSFSEISFRTDLLLGPGAHAFRWSAGGSAPSAVGARCQAASRSRRSSVTSALAVSRIASA
jgi:hypothetical protein